MTRATVRRVVARAWDDGLHVDTVRGVGFRAVERDQWAGPYRRSYTDAAKDVRERNQRSRAA